MAVTRPQLTSTINAFANAVVNNSWKGGGDPAEVPICGLELKIARMRLHHIMDRLFDPDEGPEDGQAKSTRGKRKKKARLAVKRTLQADVTVASKRGPKKGYRWSPARKARHLAKKAARKKVKGG